MVNHSSRVSEALPQTDQTRVHKCAILAADASRPAALLVADMLPVCALIAPAGAKYPNLQK